MSKEIIIVKAKLDKDGKLVVSYNQKLPEGNQRMVKDEENTTPVHPDLTEAFQGLNIHLARLCEQYSKEGDLSPDLVECRSFSLKGEDDSAGITLSGLRKVANNKSFAINTPFLHWGREDNYAEMQELIRVVELCEEEVTLYLKGKHAEDPQGKLFPTDGESQDFTPGGFAPIEKLPFLTDKAAAQMVTAAALDKDHLILIPCANDGTLLKVALTTDTDMHIDYNELEASNRKTLIAIKGGNYVGGDFLQMESANFYDRVIIAPPRNKVQEATHLLKCWNVLKPGGRMVAAVSMASLSGNKKSTNHFVEWLKEVDSKQTALATGGFTKKGEEVKCVMIVIDKPEA